MDDLALYDGQLAAIDIARHELAAKSGIDTQDDIKYLGQNAFEQVVAPLFKRLGHNRMVRVAKRFARNVERAVKFDAL